MIKFSRYAEGGIGQYWILDPSIPSIEVYTLRDSAYHLLVEGSGSQPISVLDPLALTIIPSELVDR